MLFPEDGLVYDYALDDGGISKFDADDDEVDDTSSGSEVQFSSSKFFILLSFFFINRWKFISLQTPVYRIISQSLRLCE